MANLKGKSYKKFEDIKHTENGIEFWYARELMEVLEYSQWKNFSKVIDRAMIACDNSSLNVSDHFAEVGKMVKIGSETKRKINDYKLTRYACYLIVQNSDPRKKIIAIGQTYFAIQTRRQEVSDYFNELDENKKRLVVRGDIKQWNQLLVDSAHDIGIIDNKDYAIFQNAGYMGLYGGLTVDDIKKRKKLKPKEKILDFMGSTELAANLFRISQTTEKLKKSKVENKTKANHIHYEVGRKVRKAIKDIGGTMPEDLLTPKKSIKEIEKAHMKRLKEKAKNNNLILDE